MLHRTPTKVDQGLFLPAPTKSLIQCSACGVTQEHLSGCSNCKLPYCSRTCQMSDWKNHKRNCASSIHNHTVLPESKSTQESLKLPKTITKKAIKQINDSASTKSLKLPEKEVEPLNNISKPILKLPATESTQTQDSTAKITSFMGVPTGKIVEVCSRCHRIASSRDAIVKTVKFELFPVWSTQHKRMTNQCYACSLVTAAKP